jgi:hypothetical protein
VAVCLRPYLALYHGSPRHRDSEVGLSYLSTPALARWAFVGLVPFRVVALGPVPFRRNTNLPSRGRGQHTMPHRHLQQALCAATTRLCHALHWGAAWYSWRRVVKPYFNGKRCISRETLAISVCMYQCMDGCVCVHCVYKGRTVRVGNTRCA